MMRTGLTLFWSGVMALALCGCSVAKVSQTSFSATVERGYYGSALQIARGEIGARNSTHALLWNLQAGTMERILKEYKASNDYFDRAEDAYRYFDRQSLLGMGGDTTKAFVFNDSALPYSGKHYERVMVNTYKALNFAALGDAQNARVEFNRALTRQDEAKAFFAAEAARLEEKRAAGIRSSGTGSDTVEATLNNPQLDRVIAERYKNLDGFKAYSDFINPFTNFCAGLFFWLKGDSTKAVDILKEAHAMSGNNTVTGETLARALRGERPSREMWILFENGTAPKREEIRVDVPILVERADIKYAGISLANLAGGRNAFDQLRVTAEGGQSTVTAPFASMSGVIAQEFKKELPAMAVREVSRAALKTYFQYKMNRNYGSLAGLAGALYQASTTATDIRSWSSLPNEFQAGHLLIGRNARVTIEAGDMPPLTINLSPRFDNVILYVRAVAAGVPPAYDVIYF